MKSGLPHRADRARRSATSRASERETFRLPRVTRGAVTTSVLLRRGGAGRKPATSREGATATPRRGAPSGAGATSSIVRWVGERMGAGFGLGVGGLAADDQLRPVGAGLWVRLYGERNVELALSATATNTL